MTRIAQPRLAKTLLRNPAYSRSCPVNVQEEKLRHSLPNTLYPIDFDAFPESVSLRQADRVSDETTPNDAAKDTSRDHFRTTLLTPETARPSEDFPVENRIKE